MGHGKIKQVIDYLNDICFGKYHFIIAKILRETIFLNSILQNSEAWYSVSQNNINQLEKIDNILLKKIFELPTSTPSAFLHLELGTMPVRFILMVRRLSFLQYILKEKGDTLVHSFLVAQIEQPLKGDWWEQAQQDLAEININLSLAEISKMSVESFKKKVKKCVNDLAFNWLKTEKQRSKKIENIDYSSLSIQDYLTSGKLNVQQRKLLTHLRGKMVNVKTNFSKMHKNLLCILCSQKGYDVEDSQEHILQCISLCKNGEIYAGTNYRDIFSNKSEKYEKITILFEQKIRIREKLLN